MTPPKKNKRAADDESAAVPNTPAASEPPKRAMRTIRRTTRMRAMQTLQHDNRIVKEGEVFDYHDAEGAKLPSEGIMIPVDAEIGEPPPPPPIKEAPPWTTQGFVKKAHREPREEDPAL